MKTLTDSGRPQTRRSCADYFYSSIIFALLITMAFVLTVISIAGTAERKTSPENRKAAAGATPTPPTTLVSFRCSAYSAPSIPAPLRTFYIHASAGNDSNNGATPATAWLTIAKANHSAQPGDLFLMRGTFVEQWIHPDVSGTATNKITYRKEPGQVAILDTGVYDAAIDLVVDHAVVDGFEIRNTNNPFIVYAGSNNWLRNLYIHDCGGSTFRFGSHNNRLEDSVLVDIGDGESNTSDAISLLNDADNNIVVRNYFGNAGHGAYDDTVQGDTTGFDENNVLAQNIIDNKESSNILLGGRAIGTVIECNEIKNASKTSTFNYPRAGIYLSGDNSIIRYNYIYNNAGAGILIQGYTYAGQEQFPENNQIYHNTVIGNGLGNVLNPTARHAGLFITAGDGGYPNGQAFVRNNTYENNVFWNNGGYDGANGQYYEIVAGFYSSNIPWANGFTDGNIFRYNNASNLPFYVLVRQASAGGNVYKDTPALAESYYPTWTNNTRLDPLFTSSALNNYALQSSSLMIDAGRLIPGVIYKGAAPDKGAYEFGLKANIPSDFDADRKSDISVFRPSNTTWYINRSLAGFVSYLFGLSTDKLAPGDFDGDTKTDASVFRPSNGTWYRYNSSNGQFINVQFGQSGDLPLPGDFDGDGKADIAIFRPSNSNWIILRSSDGVSSTQAFGTSGDVPLIADFDGDGLADICVFRPSTGAWYWLTSSNGQFNSAAFGTNGDIPAVGDFDGDGKTDITVFRPSNGYWYRTNSTNGQVVSTAYGQSGDIPTVGDYDGDGKDDISLFRPSNGTWYRVNSQNGSTHTEQFGVNGDRPVPAAFLP